MRDGAPSPLACFSSAPLFFPAPITSKHLLRRLGFSRFTRVIIIIKVAESFIS